MIQYLNLLDHQIFEWIQINLRSEFADPFFVAFRDKYCWLPLYIFLLSWLIFTYRKESWKIIILVLITISLTDKINSAVFKKWAKRERPCKEMYFREQFITPIPCPGAYSFPSTHAINHMGIAGVLFFTCGTEMKRGRWLLIFWALLVGWSQVYIGVHFPFDVVFGWFEGIIFSWLTYQLFIKINSLKPGMSKLN